MVPIKIQYVEASCYMQNWKNNDSNPAKKEDSK